MHLYIYSYYYYFFFLLLRHSYYLFYSALQQVVDFVWFLVTFWNVLLNKYRLTLGLSPWQTFTHCVATATLTITIARFQLNCCMYFQFTFRSRVARHAKHIQVLYYVLPFRLNCNCVTAQSFEVRDRKITNASYLFLQTLYLSRK